MSDGPTLSISGPTVSLLSKTAESIGLVAHELTTNALKYGALKAGAASLDITWSVEANEERTPYLDLRWIERGVPAVALNPARLSFGSELITEALPYQLGAETTLELRGGGVRCTIRVPLPNSATITGSDWETRQ